MIVIRKMNPINILLFLYILSIYLFTYRVGFTFISNFIAILLMGAIWVDFIRKRNKLVFNKTLAAFLLFIVVCISSTFVAIDQELVISKVMTMILIFILVLSLVNYINTIEKLDKIIRYFIYSGFIASIYILWNADFTEVARLGSLLGNVNIVGIIISISATFSFYIWLTERNHRHLIMLIVMLPVILLTGSRKSLLFIVLNFLMILFLINSKSYKKIIKFLVISAVFLLAGFYLIYHVQSLYLILGIRMDHFFAFITGKGTAEASLNLRSYMAELGLYLFKKKPWLGYGIDNYRVLLGREMGWVTYSHNNFIELMVGTGIFGIIVYYLTHFFALKSLYKAWVDYPEITFCYPFIAIIFSYTILSISMVYYDDKHISMLLAIGSVIYGVLRKESVDLARWNEIQKRKKKRPLICLKK